jgi:hypothetical protein
VGLVPAAFVLLQEIHNMGENYTYDEMLTAATGAALETASTATDPDVDDSEIVSSSNTSAASTVSDSARTVKDHKR